MKNDNSLFYTCSLIEFIGRRQKLRRGDVVKFLGLDAVRRIYNHADVFHCEVIDSVCDQFVERFNIPVGNFDNVASCKYDVPDYWDIGEVYSRLIEDICTNDNEIIEKLEAVFSSWISDQISNFNSDFFYQGRDYIRICFEENQLVA